MQFEMFLGGESECGTTRAEVASNRFGFDRSWWWYDLFGCNSISDVLLSDLIVFFAEMSSAETDTLRVRLVATDESSVSMSSKIVRLQTNRSISNKIAFRATATSTNQTFVNSLDVLQQTAVLSKRPRTMETLSCSPTQMN